MPAPSKFARRVMSKADRHPLATKLDAMGVYDEALNDESLWVERPEFGNHIPAALRYAERRNPGREYKWEYEENGIRIWRTK